MIIKDLISVEELKGCAVIERSVWGLGNSEVMPAAHMQATVHAGGLVAGAFEGERLVGFVYGFPAYRPGHPLGASGFHSHLMAVLPEYRKGGVGKQLKWYQRNWCSARGLAWIEWTFDPLQAKNARLNLEHLGVTVREYEVNLYGTLGGTLNAALPTDRFLALWELGNARVTRLATGARDEPLETRGIPSVLSANPDNTPSRPCLDVRAPRLLVEIPADLTALLEHRPGVAHRWRLATREVFMHYLEAGYTVTRFSGSYLLERLSTTP